MLPTKLMYVNNFKKHTDFREVKMWKTYLKNPQGMVINLIF